MIKSKKILSFFLVIALVFSAFTGCSSGRDSTSAPETPSSSETPITNIPSSEFNFSEGIDDNGFWKNIKAKDYVELIEYSGISIPSNIHTITKESLQPQIETLLSKYPNKKQITDRAIADGDTVNMDYVGSIDGIPFDGGSTDGLGTEVTIGVTSYIDDFLEQLIGHTPGESFDVNVTFPEDYGVDELNGKDAVFAVTLNYIVESTPSELSDEFVKENFSAEYGWNNISDLETYIKDIMQNIALTDYIQNYLIEKVTIKSLPENLLKYSENSMVQNVQNTAKSYNMELNEYLNAAEGVTNKDEFLNLYLEENKNTAKLYLIIQAIAEDAKITVSDNDVLEYFKENVGTDDYSAYEEYLGIPYLKMITLNQAVMDYMQDNAVLE